MIRLGDRVRDRITGFEGIATARAEDLDDSPSIRITAADTGQENLSERWVAEARVEHVDGERRTGFAP